MNNSHYRGYIIMLRRILLLISEKGLDFGDFGFYVFLVLNADWDSNHTTFGVIKKTDRQLALEHHCNPSTICRRKEVLKSYELIEFDNKRIKIKNYLIFTPKVAMKLAKKNIANLQEDIAEIEHAIAYQQSCVANMQNTDPNNSSPFKSSFKGNSHYESFSDEDLDEIDKGIERMRLEKSLQS